MLTHVVLKYKYIYKELTLRLNGTVLENVTCHKVLGVIVDNNLNWHKHIDYVC